jgi:hypothetical protein
VSVTTIISIVFAAAFWIMVLLWIAAKVVGGHETFKDRKGRKQRRERALDALVERYYAEADTARQEQITARKVADYFARHPEDRKKREIMDEAERLLEERKELERLEELDELERKLEAEQPVKAEDEE